MKSMKHLIHVRIFMNLSAMTGWKKILCLKVKYDCHQQTLCKRTATKRQSVRIKPFKLDHAE